MLSDALAMVHKNQGVKTGDEQEYPFQAALGADTAAPYVKAVLSACATTQGSEGRLQVAGRLMCRIRRMS